MIPIRRLGWAALFALALAAPAAGQPTQKLFSLHTSGTITANGGSVEMTNAGGLGSLRVQSSGTYTGTWEVQCSAAPTGVTPVYDTDDEVNLNLEGATAAPVQSVTDATAEWSANIAGCTAVRAIATSSMTGTLTIYLSATTTGGGSGGGGGGASSVVVTDVVPGTGATNAGKAEDAAHASGDTGQLALAVRRDADTTLADTTGDYAPLQVNAAGSLKVAITAGAGSGGTSLADNAGFTPATTSFTPVGGEVDDTGTTAASENSAGAFRMTTQRALHVNLRNASGTEITPATDVTEDAGETAGGTGPMVMSVRRDTQASSAGTTGDNATFNTDASGNLWVTGTVIEDAGETAGGQLSMAGSVRRDTAASSAGTTGDNATLNTDSAGLLWARLGDPCSSTATKQYLPIDIVTATTTEITPSLAGASTHYYICSVALVASAADNVAIVDDDSDGCGSVTSGVMGGTTAGEGFNLAANGGLTLGNGLGSIARTGGTNRVLCIVTSTTAQLSGTITVAAAP